MYNVILSYEQTSTNLKKVFPVYLSCIARLPTRIHTICVDGLTIINEAMLCTLLQYMFAYSNLVLKDIPVGLSRGIFATASKYACTDRSHLLCFNTLGEERDKPYQYKLVRSGRELNITCLDETSMKAFVANGIPNNTVLLCIGGDIYYQQNKEKPDKCIPIPGEEPLFTFYTTKVD